MENQFGILKIHKTEYGYHSVPNRLRLTLWFESAASRLLTNQQPVGMKLVVGEEGDFANFIAILWKPIIVLSSV